MQHIVLGTTGKRPGNPQRARAVLADAVDMFHSLGDAAGEANALLELCDSHMMLEDWEKANELAGEALSLHRTVGDRVREGIDLLNLAECNWKLANRQDAIQNVTAALRILEDSRHEYAIIAREHLQKWQSAAPND